MQFTFDKHAFLQKLYRVPWARGRAHLDAGTLQFRLGCGVWWEVHIK
jgi:hypothetical protein